MGPEPRSASVHRKSDVRARPSVDQRGVSSSSVAADTMARNSSCTSGWCRLSVELGAAPTRALRRHVGRACDSTHDRCVAFECEVALSRSPISPLTKSARLDSAPPWRTGTGIGWHWVGNVIGNRRCWCHGRRCRARRDTRSTTGFRLNSSLAGSTVSSRGCARRTTRSGVAGRQLWPFWLAPILGAVLGGVIYRFLRALTPARTDSRRLGLGCE